MRRYSYSLLPTSTIKALCEFNTLILGILPMLLTVTDLESRKSRHSLALRNVCVINTKDSLFSLDPEYGRVIRIRVRDSYLGLGIRI